MSREKEKGPKKAKQGVALFFLIGGPVLLGALLLWELHTPSPATRTPVVINRNALLSHGFAGPCMNCHTIEDVGPMELSARNMGAFNMTARDRWLLESGQRVVVPDLLMRVRVPALTRDDIMPHDYVGVCSNCHVILDVRPSPAHFEAARRNALRTLGAANARRPGPSVHPGERRSEHDEVIRMVSGFIALLLFVLSTGYVVLRNLLRRDPSRWRGRFKLRDWMRYHQLASIALLGVVLVHWCYSDRGNTPLHLAMVILFWLGAAGFAMRKNALTHALARKGVQLVHTQRYLFVALIVLLVVGHLFVGVR